MDLSDPLPETPMPLLAAWLEQARSDRRIRNPDAIALATVDTKGTPQVRFVLCRDFDPQRARFTFYTSYRSPKARELEASGRASAAFYWDPLGRQVRISGAVTRCVEADSDAYFASRHPLSQLAARASEQSAPIADRATLEAKLEAERERQGDGSERPIERPRDWGGYVIEAERIELWSSREGRLHDRGLWTRRRAAADGGEPIRWRVERLQP